MDTSSSGTGEGHTSAARAPLPASSLPRGDAHASAVATPPSTMATSEPGTSRRRPRSRTDEAVAAATPSVGSVEGRALTHAGSSNRRRRRRLSSAALMRAQRGVAAVGGLVGEWRLLREIGKVRVRQVGAVNGALRFCVPGVSLYVCVCAYCVCLACVPGVCACCVPLRGWMLRCGSALTTVLPGMVGILCGRAPFAPCTWESMSKTARRAR